MFLAPGFSFLGSDGRTLGRMAPLRKYTRIEFFAAPEEFGIVRDIKLFLLPRQAF